MDNKPQTNAQRQARYRQRRSVIIDQIFSMQGLPSIPAIATIPGWTRWKEAMARIAYQMEMIETEMSEYYDDRSERWQQSDQAETFYNNRELLRTIIDLAQDWPE